MRLSPVVFALSFLLSACATHPANPDQTVVEAGYAPTDITPLIRRQKPGMTTDDIARLTERHMAARELGKEFHVGPAASTRAMLEGAAFLEALRTNRAPDKVTDPEGFAAVLRGEVAFQLLVDDTALKVSTTHPACPGETEGALLMAVQDLTLKLKVGDVGPLADSPVPLMTRLVIQARPCAANQPQKL